MSAPFPATIFFDLGDTLIFTSGGIRQRYADTLDTLQILKARGYRLGLITNQAAGTTLAAVQAELNQLRLSRYIEPELVTLSTEIAGNVGKPAQPIFDLALSKAEHTAASPRAIFVTETAAHILAARGFGWRAILKRNAGACVPGDGECVSSLAGLLALLPALANLAGSNLDLAPPPRLVDGLWAVPIDIARITAALRFDAATHQATGDATLDFRLGTHTGCPIFDLRQTPTSAWLDGVAVPAADVAAHDFGGGSHASLRVLNRVVEAGSSHTLRLTYAVGLPQASMAGSYLPQIAWSAGPRLIFNFGFTDLGAGRYLEAFIPANLIYDQFELVLELVLLNTPIAHTPISNGTVTNLGANHWSIAFPARYAAFSPLLELRATDTLQSATVNTVLPVSGGNVAITTWKLASSAVNLAAQANAIAGFLADNENSTGRYLHGGRFTAFIHQGGMEYEGGTTTGTMALRHETFHSWWARGLKPSSQPDSWFDEAWTEYMGNGPASMPFNFASPAVELCTRNPWVRITHGGAYVAGQRVWQGVAALLGDALLRDHMRAFYQARYPRPARTEDIECHLVARTGDPTLVDAFHRFVYGFGDPAPLPDVWLRDDPADPGPNDWAGRFWDSPDLWIRNRDDDGLDHQNLEYGQDNWIHARVRNRSASATALHLVVTFNIKHFAGSQFTYPADFLPAITAAAAFDLGAGESRIVKARLPRSVVPSAGTHPCLLASVLTRFDRPVAGRHVWEQNNLAQKNLSVVDLAPNFWILLPLQAINLRPRLSRAVEIELIRPAGFDALKASLLVEKRAVATNLQDSAQVLPKRTTSAPGAASPGRLDCAGAAIHDAVAATDAATPLLTSHTPKRVAETFPGALELGFAQGKSARLPLVLRPAESQRIGLRVTVPGNAKRGTRFTVDLVQRENGKIVGGVALTVNVT